MTMDQHSINHMTVAVCHEMTPQGGKRHVDADTVFIGATQPAQADKDELASFGLRKNYNIILPCFDADQVKAGPIDFHVVMTDGETKAVTLSGGRLWKRDRRSTAILLFCGAGAQARISSKGRLIVRDMTGQYHDHGYDLALKAVRTRAQGKPGTAPVVAPIGGMLAVFDIQAVASTFAAAA